MKSRITSVIERNYGFLTLEALIACSFMAMIIPAVLSLSWSSQSLFIAAQKELESLSASSSIISDGVSILFSSSIDYYSQQFGADTCSILPADANRGFIGSLVGNPSLSLLSQTASSTISNAALTARNGFVYEVIDSNIQAQPDFYIIDARNNAASATVIASLNTGPGLAAITVDGHYAYVGNTSSVSQLQIIDVSNRFSPSLVSSLKLPLPTATSTAPHASAIFYANHTIYLGTEKWDGFEFNIIDVSNPSVPRYLGGFKINSIVNDIYVADGIAYIADADIKQMQTLDIHDPGNIKSLSYFSPAGSQVLEGKSLAHQGSSIFFGRSGGGFNNTSQYELFSMDTSSPATAINWHDIPGGVYGIASAGNYLFIATHDATAPIQIWKEDLSTKINLENMQPAAIPAMFTCDHSSLYSAILSGQGFQTITLY